jgi:hypothetical protein
VFHINKPNAVADLIRSALAYAAAWIGVVATYVMRKPAFGAFRPILACGFDLMNTPLGEIPSGNIHYLFCQLDVTGRYGFDPAATRLLENLCVYAASLSATARRKARTAVVAD